jgi:hypothetical protein
VSGAFSALTGLIFVVQRLYALSHITVAPPAAAPLQPLAALLAGVTHDLLWSIFIAFVLIAGHFALSSYWRSTS